VLTTAGRAGGVAAQGRRIPGTLDLGRGRATLHAGPGTLTVRAEAASEESLQRVQDLITRNLERFGRREHLKVNWQQPATPTN
jgi:hypothetical protein